MRVFKDVQRGLNDWLAHLLPLTLANLAWFILSLTVVLFPAATAGLFFLSNRVAYGKPPLRVIFTAGMRLYTGLAWRWALVYGGGLGLLALIFSQAGAVVQGLVIAAAVLWTLFQLYVWPLLIEQPEKRIGAALRNALLLCVAAPGYTLALAGLGILGGALLLPLYLVPLAIALASPGALLATHAVLGQLRASGLPPDDNRAARMTR